MARSNIYSHAEISQMVGMMVQKGMNYRPGQRDYSILLMSRRINAPYKDEIIDEGKTLIYEGHDVPSSDATQPKRVDQQLVSNKGTDNENGKFFKAAKKKNEKVRVFEKIKTGIWVDNGYFILKDAWEEYTGVRRVYRFRLEIMDDGKYMPQELELDQTRVIPSFIKQEVYKRDKGQCQKCGSKDNLHFDHILAYSKGGTSLLAENIQLLCARHNFEKSDKF